MASEQRSTKTQNLILESRKRLSISGAEEVFSFDDSCVRMQTSLGELIIHGEQLHIQSLSVETGESVITGTISELIYEQPRTSGFLARLLRSNENRDR